MKISICIPAYNRVRHLSPLLESILAQDCPAAEIVICEDHSPEREAIREVVESFQAHSPVPIRYHENAVNLGFEGNIRSLIDQAVGDYCFFMGNDDLMKPGALNIVDRVLREHGDAGVVIKAYEWFVGNPENVQQTIRYVTDKYTLPAGEAAIVAAFRRAGVISGFIIHRAAAAAVATNALDGSLYYQMYITGRVLAQRSVVLIPDVLVSCRGDEPPDFGNSAAEKGKYTPGKYTPDARLRMVGGVLDIADTIEKETGCKVAERIRRDYASYFFPYIRDQLRLPLREYLQLYRGFSGMGLSRYPVFHLYMVLCYALGEQGFDRLVNVIRRSLGRTPRIGGAL